MCTQMRARVEKRTNLGWNKSLVVNHISIYLVQLQLCCRLKNPKMGYLLSLTGVVGIPMVSNHSFSFLLDYFLSYLIYFFFTRSGIWVFLTLICKFQPEIIRVIGQVMAYIHCSNTDNCCNKRFVITQYRNEFSLRFWMAWCYFPQRLVKATSFTSFIWRGFLNNWPVWHVFMQCHILIPWILLLLFFIYFWFSVVAIFVTYVYLDHKFIVLCHNSLPSKTAWAKILSVVGDCIQFFLPYLCFPFF